MAKNESASKAAKVRRLHNRVLKASSARNGTRQVLLVMMRLGSFYENQTRLSKDQIIAETRLHLNTVKAALKFLREEGTIRPIKHATGGHGMATTYSFHAAGEGACQRGDGDRSDHDCLAWDETRAQFEAENSAIFERWIEPLMFVSLTGDKLVLRAPTPFTADHVKNNHADELLRIARHIDDSIRRLEITARET